MWEQDLDVLLQLLALEISKANVFGIDISLDALNCEENKARLNVKNVFFMR